MANRTPVMQTSWFGQSPYIVDRSQTVDRGALPEVVVTASAPALERKPTIEDYRAGRVKRVPTGSFGGYKVIVADPTPPSYPPIGTPVNRDYKYITTGFGKYKRVPLEDNEPAAPKQIQEEIAVKQLQKAAQQQAVAQQQVVTSNAKQKVEPKKPASAKSNKSIDTSKLTDSQIASMIIARQGGFGDGAQRKAALGQRYAAVQALINQRLRPAKNPIATVEREAPIIVSADVPNVVDPTLAEIAQASATPNLRDPRYLAIPGMLPYNDIPGFVAAHNAMVAEEPTSSEDELFFNGNLYSGTPAVPFLENPESEEVYTYPTAKKTSKEVKKEQKENTKEEKKKSKEENKEKRRRLKRTASRKPVKKDKNKD